MSHNDLREALTALLCERHQFTSPTRQPCAACTQDIGAVLAAHPAPTVDECKCSVFGKCDDHATEAHLVTDEAQNEVIGGESCHTYLVADRPLLNRGATQAALYRPECLIHGELAGGFFTQSTAEKIADEHRAALTVEKS